MKKFAEASFGLNFATLNYKNRLSNGERLRAVTPIRVVDLIGKHLEEENQMDIENSFVYPVVIEGKPEPGRFEFAALINHSLSGIDLLRLFNQFAPVKRTLFLPYDAESWSRDVAADWAFMISPENEGSGARTRLEKVHSPTGVPGFAEFLPHVRLFVDALDNRPMIKTYKIPVHKMKVLPLIHVVINGNEKDFKHEVLDPLLTAELSRKLLLQIWKHESRLPEKRTILDTFAGMAIPPYIDPDSTRSWPIEIHKQRMSIAQAPVLNFQNRKQHFETPFMKNLQEHIAASV